MASTNPPSGHSSQRTLAAIVFTDVVSFSARMQRDEMGTLTLLQRDFAEMRRVCEAHEGAVLKTTGDGLLMTFSSAVHAVACALAMQRQFAAEAKGHPAGDALQHRIGIHLGDVLVQNQDVMGDGVNIAARLQAEAEPGGICISQTVYDVVKNKLELHVLSIGARDLKNISETIPVYRLLMEAHSLGTTTGPKSGATMPSFTPVAKRRTPTWIIAGGVAAVLGAVVATSVLVRRPSPKPDAPATVVAAAIAPVTAEEETDREIATRVEIFQQLRTQYLDKYDFEGMARAMREKNDSPASRVGQQPMMMRSAEQMAAMKDWLLVSLRRFGRPRPLVVPDFSGDAAKETKDFLTPDKRVVFLENGTPQPPRELSELKAATLGAIIVAAVREVKPPAPREAFMGAMTFAKVYSLPLMQDALTKIRPRMDREPGKKK